MVLASGAREASSSPKEVPCKMLMGWSVIDASNSCRLSHLFHFGPFLILASCTYCNAALLGCVIAVCFKPIAAVLVFDQCLLR